MLSSFLNPTYPKSELNVSTKLLMFKNPFMLETYTFILNKHVLKRCTVIKWCRRETIIQLGTYSPRLVLQNVLSLGQWTVLISTAAVIRTWDVQQKSANISVGSARAVSWSTRICYSTLWWPLSTFIVA